MVFPVSISDAGLWVAVLSIILLATSEILSPYYGGVGIAIERRRLRRVALGMGMLFLFFVAYRVATIILPL